MSDFEAQQIDLANRIVAFRNGQGARPTDEELHKAVEAIRTKRAEYVQTRKSAKKADAADAATAKAAVSALNLNDLGI